ncbi:unnamed protein product [Nesidiocoris tenuis]|uniref:Serine-threonine/tyrosine-protein kinase catalytic domain-containing protein n=1 Tax=Nesidiocoris tenuis TaxID=355587 RepID=A0A6H5GJS7_9HEMI|nr:unnamed protein product [Nesidiocoris tenuis]
MEELLPLNHENISCVLGACFDQAPPLLVMEYTEHGDLYQFLQNHVAESTSLPHSHAETLRSHWLNRSAATRKSTISCASAGSVKKRTALRSKRFTCSCSGKTSDTNTSCGTAEKTFRTATSTIRSTEPPISRRHCAKFGRTSNDCRRWNSSTASPFQMFESDGGIDSFFGIARIQRWFFII